MKLISFGDMPINEGGAGYHSSLAVESQVPAGVEPMMAGRTGALPVLGAIRRPARYLVIETYVDAGAGGDKRALQEQWYRWFEFGVERNLVINDDDELGEPRYLGATAFAIEHDVDGDGWSWRTLLVVSGVIEREAAWRALYPTMESWHITASGTTKEITNGGSLDAYPQITITPTVGVGAPAYYMRFVAVRWRAVLGAARYPVEITGGGIDTRIGSTHFVDAAGDDIRISVNDVDSDYWLVGPDSAATKIWMNLTFSPTAETTLATAMGVDAVTTVVGGDLSGFPEAGLLLIGSELFSYTGTSGSSFTGVARAQYGTVAASHGPGTAVEWIQHRIVMTYGDTARAARAVDVTRKPILKLSDSSNTSWVYEEFYEAGAERSGAWVFQNLSFGTAYGGNRGAEANPYEELGIYLPPPRWNIQGTAQWYLFNPCGIVSANFTNGEKFPAYNTSWRCAVRSAVDGASWLTVYSIPAGSLAAWEAWSYNAASLAAGTRYVGLLMDSSSAPVSVANRQPKVECADVTVGLDGTKTPVGVVMAEMAPQGRVNATLTNISNGESLALSFTAIDENNSLFIHSDLYVVRWGAGGPLAYGAVAANNVRRYLMRLAPGVNVLKYEDDDLETVDISIAFQARWIV